MGLHHLHFHYVLDGKIFRQKVLFPTTTAFDMTTATTGARMCSEFGQRLPCGEIGERQQDGGLDTPKRTREPPSSRRHRCTVLQQQRDPFIIVTSRMWMIALFRRTRLTQLEELLPIDGRRETNLKRPFVGCHDSFFNFVLKESYKGVKKTLVFEIQ